MRFRLAALIAAVIGLTAGQAAQRSPNGSLAAAAASDLQSVFPELSKGFTRATGITTRVSFGSSGNFVAQIRNGAPFDVFLSADIDYPRQLIASGHADGDSLSQYATGAIVLWTRRETGIDVGRGLRVLTDGRVRRVAIANPQHAPYGRAAVAALRSEGIYEAVERKLVLGENVSQAAQLADSGNADVAIIGHALALGPALRKNGVQWEIPSRLHPPIEQGAVIVSASRAKDAARRFLEYLGSAEARRTLERFGFSPPNGGP